MEVSRATAGLILTGALIAVAGTAYAGSLFAQESIEADGVRVRRMHDAEAGVNCYVASDQTYSAISESMPVAISCVRVR